MLKAISDKGSISAAARQIGMSYRRAWTLVDEMNRGFCEPIVLTRVGGSPTRAAELSTLGRQLLEGYKTLEAEVGIVSEPLLDLMNRKRSAGKAPS